MKQWSIFAERFQKLRGKQTQSVFAKHLGISRQTVSFYEAGQRTPDAMNLRRIAEVCNVSADWLIGLSDIPIIQSDIRIAQKTLGISGAAAENLAKIARQPPRIFYLAELDRQTRISSLNAILESPNVLQIAEAASALMHIGREDYLNRK